jgi:lipid-binding SYLF domain-containing protein
MRLLTKMLALGLLLVAMIPLTSTADFIPAHDDPMQLSAAQAIVEMNSRDPGMSEWFSNAAGFAVFPSVGKGGIVIGGARGRGLVIANDRVVGSTTLSQFTIGLQLGGQVYSQFIFFRDEPALNEFKRGNFEFGAQASAVAVTLGASADANYNGGVAVFTMASGGLMFEASVGGQRFTFTPVE